ncbi:MAG TPA: hypothetical protein VI455_12950 [Terriglobia bacterium]
MSDMERWWKDDSIILNLRDNPGETAKPEQTCVGEVPLNSSEPAKPPEPGPAGKKDEPEHAKTTGPAGSAVAAKPAPAEPAAKQKGQNVKGTAAPVTEQKAARSAKPRSGGLWAAVVILALALGAVTWYGDLALRQNNVSLTQLPGLQRLATGLKGRMDATEAKLLDLTDRWESVQNRVADLDHKLGSGLQRARRQTQELVAEAQGRMESEMARNDQAVNGRLAGLESTEQDQVKRLAAIQNQVSDLGQEMAAGHEQSERDLAGVRQQVDQNGSDLSALNQKLERRKVDFEASKDSAQELESGISLTVTKTNVGYQRFEGYLTLASESRTLWLRDVGAQQSVVFFARESSQPYDLVVTAVSANGVVGYLMLPAGGGQAEGTTRQGTADGSDSTAGF